MLKDWWERVRRALSRERYERHQQIHESVDRDAAENLDRVQKGIRRNPFR